MPCGSHVSRGGELVGCLRPRYDHSLGRGNDHLPAALNDGGDVVNLGLHLVYNAAWFAVGFWLYNPVLVAWGTGYLAGILKCTCDHFARFLNRAAKHLRRLHRRGPDPADIDRADYLVDRGPFWGHWLPF